MIHTGDLITEGMPVLDYRNGASAVEWVSVLDKVLELDFDVVIPGVSGYDDEMKARLGK